MPNEKSEIKKAYMAVFLLGLVSLFGDIVYEGSRGLIPEYLKYLGASAIIVGAIMGLGELISYVSRLAGGIIADKTKSYWALVFLGYGLIIALPFLPVSEFVGGWMLAAVFILLERLGKGLRTPARDTIISFASKAIGRGKAFGLHELLDQIGAISGPLVLAAILAISNSYTWAFAALFVPYLILIIILFLVYRSLKVYGEPPPSERREGEKILGRKATLYIVAVTLNTIALFPVALILYMATNLAEAGILGVWFIPVLYAGIQLVDAPLALITGIIYDKLGLKTLFLPFVVTIFVAPLALRGDFVSIILAAALFGLVLGTKESVYRAAIADLSPPEVRATAYGVLNTAIGVGALIAGVVYGYIIDIGGGPMEALTVSLLGGIASIIFLFYVVKEK
ncbi:MAG: MFS transporter [Thermoprotei archaeon]|nr:MAG: MFS transporter [Thermoprotei archaeon]